MTHRDKRSLWRFVISEAYDASWRAKSMTHRDGRSLWRIVTGEDYDASSHTKPCAADLTSGGHQGDVSRVRVVRRLTWTTRHATGSALVQLYELHVTRGMTWQQAEARRQQLTSADDRDGYYVNRLVSCNLSGKYFATQVTVTVAN